MVNSGPQIYPGASTTHWYQNTYPGDTMDVNVVVLHTTEGRSLPDYSGGSVAPTLTAVPDLAAKKLTWYQHFNIDTSSRALVNLAGGVETNTLNVCQVELVGTCAPATHTAWGSSPHIYWPQAPDWALTEVARFLTWMHTNHGVPLSGPSKWPAYPSSYGTSNGARMTGAAWNGFSGVCGHLHVPENVHGDPGAIDFAKLIALAQGGTEETDMPTLREIAEAVLTTDGIIANPVTGTDNAFITLSTSVRNIEIVTRRTEIAAKATAAAQTAAITAMAAALGKVDAALDVPALVAEVKQAVDTGVSEALASIDIHVTTS